MEQAPEFRVCGENGTVLMKYSKAAPHNGARRFGERFWRKRKYEKCGNTGCISHFSYCTVGAKDPPKPAAPIVRCCPKVHTCDFADEACLESGDAFQVCDFHDIKLGIMICYDREYPESARVLMLKGAEIILVPNDCGAMKPRLCALSTRAYENMVGIAMANPNGENAGNSCAFSPICWDENGRCVDNVLLMADDVTEGLYYAVFDMDAIRSYREEEMMGNTFRKVKAYGLLLSEQIEYPFIRDNQSDTNI